MYLFWSKHRRNKEIIYTLCDIVWRFVHSARLMDIPATQRLYLFNVYRHYVHVT